MGTRQCAQDIHNGAVLLPLARLVVRCHLLFADADGIVHRHPRRIDDVVTPRDKKGTARRRICGK